MRERSRGDPKIVSADEIAGVGHLRPEAGVRAGDRLTDRDGVQTGQQMLDERTTTCPARAGRDALELDEYVGVDQDGHDDDGELTDWRS